MLGRKREDLGSKADAKKRKKWQERAGKEPCDMFYMIRPINESFGRKSRKMTMNQQKLRLLPRRWKNGRHAAVGRCTGWVEARPKWLKKSCAGRFAKGGWELFHAGAIVVQYSLPKCQMLHVCFSAEMPAASTDFCGFSSQFCRWPAHCRVPWLPSRGAGVPRSGGRRANGRGPSGAGGGYAAGSSYRPVWVGWVLHVFRWLVPTGLRGRERPHFHGEGMGAKASISKGLGGACRSEEASEEGCLREWGCDSVWLMSISYFKHRQPKSNAQSAMPCRTL